MKRFLVPLLTLSATLALTPAFAADGEALFQSKTCVACHAIDTKLVGPAYTEVAAKYAGQGNAIEMLADHIKNGSQGEWGSIPMPPNAVTEEEAKILAEWVMEQQ